MARRRYESTLQTVSEINVTPLMDLTFLLLIVFMITAPMLEYEIDVSPPKHDAEAIEEAKSVMVNLSATGQILFQKEQLDLARLTQRLLFFASSQPDTTVLIRADGDRPYREVIDVMKAVRAANIASVSLVTQPEDLE